MTEQRSKAGETEGSFMPGEYAIPTAGERAPVERKSPPLRDIQPGRDRNIKVDPGRYYRREEAEREWRHLWPKVWLCAGRVSDLPTKGSW